jgi:monoamine oxidase
MKAFNYRSKKWRRASLEAQRRVGWRCELCGQSKVELEAAGQYLVTHHRMDASLFPDVAFDARFLLVCCVNDHEQIHGRSFAAQPLPRYMQQLEFDYEPSAPSAQLIDDMGLGEKADRRRAKLTSTAEIQTYHDEYTRARAIAEREELDQQQKHDLAQGVLEEYSRLRSIGGEEQDDGATTKTTDSDRRRPA